MHLLMLILLQLRGQYHVLHLSLMRFYFAFLIPFYNGLTKRIVAELQATSVNDVASLDAVEALLAFSQRFLSSELDYITDE